MKRFMFCLSVLAAMSAEVVAMRCYAGGADRLTEAVCRKKTAFFRCLSDLSIDNVESLRRLGQAKNDCMASMNGRSEVMPNKSLLAIMVGIVNAAEAAFRLINGTETSDDVALVKIYAEAPGHRLGNIDLLEVLQLRHPSE